MGAVGEFDDIIVYLCVWGSLVSQSDWCKGLEDLIVWWMISLLRGMRVFIFMMLVGVICDTLNIKTTDDKLKIINISSFF